MILETLRMAFHALNAYKLRSFLSSLGIAIGVFSIIIILTTMNGLTSYVHSTLANLGSGTVYIQKFSFEDFMGSSNHWETFIKVNKRPNIREKELEKIRENSVVADIVAPIFKNFRVAKYGKESTERVLVIGSNEQLPQLTDLEVEYGRFYTSAEVTERSRVVVVGPTIVEQLFLKEDPLGKQIKIDGLNYRVVGILKKQGKIFGEDVDDRLYIPYKSIPGYTGRFGMAIGVKVHDKEKLNGLLDELTGIVRASRKLSPSEENNFSIFQLNTLGELFDQITFALYWVVFAISCVSLIVGGIGIMNIMIVSVTERTKEIGIRKSLGAKRKSILTQFLAESVALSVLGGIPGILLGVVAAYIGFQQIDIPFELTLTPFLVGFLFSAFIGTVSGFIPAYRASKLPPVEALRFE